MEHAKATTLLYEQPVAVFRLGIRVLLRPLDADAATVEAAIAVLAKMTRAVKDVLLLVRNIAAGQANADHQELRRKTRR